MQRDFQINALRTKTKYKLTALRISMKNHILKSLRDAFTGVSLQTPLIRIIHSLESPDVTPGAPPFGQESMACTVEMPCTVDIPQAATPQGTPQDHSVLSISQVSRKSERRKNKTDKKVYKEIIGDSSLGLIKPPGLKRYKEENASVNDTVEEIPKPRGRVEIRIKKKDS